MNAHSSDKKKIILEATLRLIALQGVHATPMSQIAKESKVAAGTIYTYFESKDALLNELYLEEKAKLGEAINKNLNIGETYKEQFANLWKSVFYFFISSPDNFYFASQLAHSPLISKEAKESGQKRYSKIYDFLKEGIEKEYLIDSDPFLFAEILYGNVLTAANLALSKVYKFDDNTIEKFIDFSWRSIAKI